MIQVPPNSHIRVAVSWKKIWQHGVAQIVNGGHALEVPYRIATGMTFDQSTIDG